MKLKKNSKRICCSQEMRLIGYSSVSWYTDITGVRRLRYLGYGAPVYFCDWCGWDE